MERRDDADFDALLVEGDHAGTNPSPSAVLARTSTSGARRSAPSGTPIPGWIGPALVILVAAITRLWNLGSPATLVFDETFYVKDAYTLLNLGYEAKWPDNPNPAFEAGNTDSYLTGGSFVVHPPLGKWLISLGFLAFGADHSVSWRIATAVVGILAVVLLMVIAKGLFQSTLVATIAGLLFAIDGNAIVMSRVALLDNFVMFFALVGFGAILLDRFDSATRLGLWMTRRQGSGKSTDGGPALWWRPWLVAAGVAFGLAAAVKWNGLYFLAGFAIYTLIVDAISRRAAGIESWAGGTVLRQAPLTFLLTVPVALSVYLASFTGWFRTAGGYGRQFAEQPGNAWEGPLAWVPTSFQSFLEMQRAVYSYHVKENSPHPYSANPLTWLLEIRPTSMYYEATALGQNGCTADACGTAITGIANPLIWWAGGAAMLYLLYRLVRYREWRVGLILTGIGVGYLPWLLYLNRTVFQFYTIVFEPYLILAIAFVAWRLLGSRSDPPAVRQRGERIVAVYLVAAILISVFFWPLWSGLQVDWRFIQAHYWLPTWK